jgi:hypothetical protein
MAANGKAPFNTEEKTKMDYLGGILGLIMFVGAGICFLGSLCVPGLNVLVLALIAGASAGPLGFIMVACTGILITFLYYNSVL